MTCLNSWIAATRPNTRIDGISKLPGRLPTKVRQDLASSRVIAVQSCTAIDNEYDNLNAFTRHVARAYPINRFNFLAVGGIYTVIRSKAYVSTEEMGDQFCLIGPYKEQSARTEVEEADFPPHNPLHQAVQVLRDQGYKVSFFSREIHQSRSSPIQSSSS